MPPDCYRQKAPEQTGVELVYWALDTDPDGVFDPVPDIEIAVAAEVAADIAAAAVDIAAAAVADIAVAAVGIAAAAVDIAVAAVSAAAVAVVETAAAVVETAAVAAASAVVAVAAEVVDTAAADYFGFDFDLHLARQASPSQTEFDRSHQNFAAPAIAAAVAR